MRKKIVLELETETGFIYDSAGMYVGSSMTMKPSKFSTGVPIDAKLADSEADGWHPDSNPYSASTAIADTIRARGETK